MKFLSVVLVFFFSAFVLIGDDSPGEAKNIYGVLIQSILDGDASVFQELGNEAFRKQMTTELFQTAQAEIGPRLQAGYTSAYLGKIAKNGKDLYLWKIVGSRSEEELLVSLVLEKNKVAAFYIQ